MSETVIKIENLRKQYKLGAIGGQTLNAELQSWWARKRGKEDPNLKIGQNYENMGESFWALDGINLEVKKGEALGIIGGNGAGKSTLLKILSRVTAPTEGDIWINGRISSMLEVGTGFHKELTGRENIYMNGAILGMTKKEVDEKIESIVDFSECRQFIDTPVKRYSSGMYVKLAFAVASHLDSEILIMDEVLAVGDMKFQKKCLGKMGDEAQNGKTVLYVSHNMSTIRNLCTRCIVLQQGKVIFNGDVEKAIEVYSDVDGKEMSVTDYSFEKLKRRNYSLGKLVEIMSFKFIDVERALFPDESGMRFEIVWRNEVPFEDLHLRCVVKSTDSIVIGMTESEVLIQGKQEGTHVTNFWMDTKNIVSGDYKLTISINSISDTGAYEMRDEAPLNIYFSVVENSFLNSNRSRWIKSYWGSVRFDQLKIE